MFDGKNILLRPAAALYGGVTYFRNLLYDKGIFASDGFGIPVICVGNLSMGGTGKTPHTEYIARLLSDEHSVAVLSRGYKRKTSGFRFVEESSRVADAGDEPLQIKMKYPSLTVAVDADRINGVKMILAQKPGTGIILLDDGFQHRSIKPGLSIILTDFSKPFTADYHIPFGSLRESSSGAARADIVVVTKTPPDAPARDKERIANAVRSKGVVKNVFFTSFRYLEPVNVFDRNLSISPVSFRKSEVVLVTGIARPEPLVNYLENQIAVRGHIRFPDHHDFSKTDLAKISSAFHNIKSSPKYVITTEKDAVRFREIPDLSEAIIKAMFYIPVAVDFPDGDQDQFDKLIRDYAGKDKRNG